MRAYLLIALLLIPHNCHAFSAHKLMGAAYCDTACQDARAAAAACNASLADPVISATAYSYNRIDIALVSGAVGATSYTLKWGTVSGNRSNSIATTLPYSHTSSMEDTDYYYSLIATNSTCSKESPEVSATTLP